MIHIIIVKFKRVSTISFHANNPVLTCGALSTLIACSSNNTFIGTLTLPCLNITAFIARCRTFLRTAALCR